MTRTLVSDFDRETSLVGRRNHCLEPAPAFHKVVDAHLHPNQ